MAAVVLSFLASGASSVYAQAQVRNFPTQPILVVRTGGHDAPVRSLIFSAPDGSQLLSAGMDKIINVWNLKDGRQELSRTIRPPIWRGYRGVIYALALSPAVEGRTQRLAVAGFGVESAAGNIGIFRFPGSNNVTTGDIEAQLLSGTANEPKGHTNTVMGLAFDPTGKEILASCSMDGTARIWDLTRKITAGVLRGHVGPINALAFTPDGQRLVTGGQDGVLRIWDVNRHTLLAQAAPNPADRNPNDPAGDEILCLAVSPDGQWVVVGRENGLLLRYDSATLRTAARLNPVPRGPVETLAISHDGKRLVTSIVAIRNPPADRPRVDCDVELRAMPDGRVTAKVDTASNLVYACTFSPDDRYVAFAGGDAQGVYIKDLTDPAKPLMALEGQGRSLWDVAFQADSQAVGYARQRTDLPGAPAQVEGFDLQARQLKTLDRATLKGAIASSQGWTIRPTGPWALVVENAQGVRFPIALDKNRDRRWWSYSFIPAGPGHARAAVAIGCEAGVAIYGFDAGQRGYARTRLFAGHNGPVYALAPAPDGKWLATASSDQTVRLWRLAGCDVLPKLGATFGPAEGASKGPVITAIEPQSFAEAMGLLVGDRIESFFSDGAPVNTNLVRYRVDASVPGTNLEFQVRRGAELINLGSTKRDAPALTLFPSTDHEWVLWMPDGFYDTSIAGDRKYLGWHRNRADLTQPTDFFSADKFEQELRRTDVLTRLWSTADPVLALAPVPKPAQATVKIVDEDRPPAVRIVEPARQPDAPLIVRAAALSVRALASSEGQRPIRSLRFLIDSRQGPSFDFPAAPEVDQRAELTVSPGLHRVNVVATNDRGKERAESFDLLYVQPQPKLPQFVVRSIGVEQFNGRDDLAIRYADRDARDVERFLADQARPRSSKVDQEDALVGAKATSAAIREVLAELDSKCDNGELGDGDTVILMIESHVLTSDRGGLLVGCDAGPGLPSQPALPTTEISDGLARIADYGCRVMLLIDGVHESSPREWNSRVNSWARELWKRNVITFVASNQGPSQRLAFQYRHGAFAQGIVESLDVPARSRLWANSEGPLTLRDFQEAVVQRVQDLTSRRQVPACYVPESLPSQIPLLDPHAAGHAKASEEAQ